MTDPSGAVVPEAKVEISDNSKGTIRAAKTDREGVYRFSFLAPGNYTLTVTRDGFGEGRRAVNVLLGPPGTVNITLDLAKESTTVKVTAEAPLIQAENGDVSTTMSQKQISELPNPGNDLTYIAQTAPGAIMNTDGGTGNFSILGMPGTSNLFTLNGMNENNNSENTNFTGAMGMLLGQNQIQEATVVSNGYSGQFGGAAGANVNYITKSGSNEIHGNAQYYWNGRVLNANDWINKASGNPRPFDIASQWAGSVGGPIKKNRLFFFFDSEGLRVLLPVISPVVLPSPQFEAATIANIDSRFGSTSASDAFYKQMFSLYNSTKGASAASSGNFNPQDPTGCTGFVGPNGLGTSEPCAVHFLDNLGSPSQESIVSGRVDWNVRDNDRAFLLLQYDDGHQATWIDPISPLFNAYGRLSWWQGQFNETHTFGPRAANQFLVAGTYRGSSFQVKNPSEALSAFPNVLQWYGAGNGLADLGGFDYVYGIPIGTNTTQYQVSEDFAKTWAKHKVGFGANLLRTDQTYFGVPNGVGQLVPETLDAFYQGGVDPSSPATNFTLLRQTFASDLSQRVAVYNLAFYVQDEWHARSNLTLTLALRLEHPSNPICQNRCVSRLAGPFESISHDPDQPYNQAILSNQKQALINFDSIVWAPRFSFAWQLLGVSHNTVIRGGIGIFYDPLPLGASAYDTVNPPLYNPYVLSGYSLAPNETNSLSENASASNAAFVQGFASGQNLSQIEAVDPNFSPPGIYTPSEKTHLPQYQKWSLEVQQAFGATTSLSIGYYGNHGIHEYVQNPSANAFSSSSFNFGPSFATGLCTSPPVLPCADPRFSQVTEFYSAAVSNYNGMVVSFQHRFNRWGQGLFQVNYTYGHALDELSNGGVMQFTFGSSVYPQDPSNLRSAYGPAEYDVRHSINANYVWEVPVKAALRGHGSDYLVKGWQVSGTILARTGFPYTVIDYQETNNLAGNNFFGTIYAVPVGPLGSAPSCGKGAAIPLSPNPCQPPQLSGTGAPDPGANFVQSGCETGFNTGNLPGSSGPCSGLAVSFAQGRNRYRGPDYFDTDFAIMKNTKIPGWENGTLGIGFQFFNFFNHPNFGFPDNFSSDAMFGEISYMEQPPTSILGSGLGGDVAPRMIQLKVQLQF